MTTETGTFTASASQLLQAIKRVKPAMAKDEARPVLAAILIEADDDGRVNFVAADNYRIHIQAVEPHEGSMIDWTPVVMARQGVPALEAMLRAAKGTAIIVTRLDGRVRFDATHGSVECLTVGSPYPAYRRAVPGRGVSPTVSLNPGLLLGLPDDIVVSRVYVTDPLAPVLVSTDSGEGFTAVIMPVRTSDTPVSRPSDRALEVSGGQ